MARYPNVPLFIFRRWALVPGSPGDLPPRRRVACDSGLLGDTTGSSPDPFKYRPLHLLSLSIKIFVVKMSYNVLKVWHVGQR